MTGLPSGVEGHPSSLRDFAENVVAPAVSDDTEVSVNGQVIKPANPLGPQQGPSSVPKIEAETKRVVNELEDFIPPPREKTVYLAARRYSKTNNVPEDYARQKLLSDPELLKKWSK